jgi:hypothetical protein
MAAEPGRMQQQPLGTGQRSLAGSGGGRAAHFASPLQRHQAQKFFGSFFQKRTACPAMSNLA